MAKNRTKNKSSYRVLPLIKEVEKLLLKIEKENIKNGINNPKYSDEFSEYIYLDKNGMCIKPNYVSQTFGDFLEMLGRELSDKSRELCIKKPF